MIELVLYFTLIARESDRALTNVQVWFKLPVVPRIGETIVLPRPVELWRQRISARES
jgi:hypothetical protein